MKKIYQKIELVLILFNEDVIRTSDNVEDMPDFPENLG